MHYTAHLAGQAGSETHALLAILRLDFPFRARAVGCRTGSNQRGSAGFNGVERLAWHC